VTLFEYISIAYSLVLSFSVLRILGGIPYAIQRDRRYWVHLSYVIMALATSLTTFWAFWSYQGVEWTLPTLVLVLANPSLIYMFAALLLPPDPTATESWREHYFAVRVRLFSTGIAWGVASMMSMYLLAGVPIFHPLTLMYALHFAVQVTGVLSDDPRVHAALILIMLSAFLAVSLTIFARPGVVGPLLP